MDFRDEDLAQKIRILDVAVIGPLMIYAGVKSKELPEAARAALVIFGASTIGYNGINLLQSDKQHELDEELFKQLEAEIKTEEKA